MALTAKKKGSFEPAPEGVHRAVCVSVVDLGTHYNETFKKSTRKVRIGWELADEFIDVDGEKKPVVVGQRYTLSLDKKANLKSMLESWRGRAFTDKELEGFDLKNVLGAPCQLQIIHVSKNNNTYADVKAVMSMPKGSPKFKPVNKLVWFSLEEGFDIPADFPDWLKEVIMKSDEYVNHAMGQSAEDFGDSSEPECTTDTEPF